MTTAKGTRYDLSVRIVEHVDDEGEPCGFCSDFPSEPYSPIGRVLVQAYVTLGEPVEHRDAMIESCLSCLIPVLDSTPYLDTDRTIIVEVARSASRRPF
jgi:hypothetical protein